LIDRSLFLSGNVKSLNGKYYAVLGNKKYVIELVTDSKVILGVEDYRWNTKKRYITDRSSIVNGVSNGMKELKCSKNNYVQDLDIVANTSLFVMYLGHGIYEVCSYGYLRCAKDSGHICLVDDIRNKSLTDILSDKDLSSKSVRYNIDGLSLTILSVSGTTVSLRPTDDLFDIKTISIDTFNTLTKEDLTRMFRQFYPRRGMLRVTRFKNGGKDVTAELKTHCGTFIIDMPFSEFETCNVGSLSKEKRLLANKVSRLDNMKSDWMPYCSDESIRCAISDRFSG